MRHFLLWNLVVLFFLALAAAMPAAAEEAAKETGECVRVVTVYGEDICKSDITPGEETLQRVTAYVEATGEDPQKAIHNIKLSGLFGLIWEKVLVHKYGEKAIQPTKAETDAYLKALHAASAAQYKYDKETRELITELMKQNAYSAEDQAKLDRIGMEKDRAIMMYEMRDKVPAEMKGQIREGERMVAENMIKSWKVKKLLYEEYGGRLIFQQAGLEPIDAFKELLDEIKRGDDVVLHDKEYKDVYKAMEEYVAMDHTVVPVEDNAEIKNYFESLTWLYDSKVGAQAHRQTLDILKSIPAEKIEEGKAEEKAVKTEEKE